MTFTEMFITMYSNVFTFPATKDPTMSEPGGRHLWLPRNDLASYVRPFPRDFSHLARLIAEGRSVGNGIVVDPRDLRRSEDLREVALEEGVELVLDPLSVELASENGHKRKGAAELPWASDSPHQAEGLDVAGIYRYSDALAGSVLGAGMSAVLAPTHFLESLSSPWLATDFRLTLALRECLNRRGAHDTPIYYPLIVRLKSVQSEAHRVGVLQHLRRLVAAEAVDAVWLRVPGFGATQSGPVNLRRYFELARGLHGLGVPVVGERTGTIGLALLAFGAVGGIEQGVTFGERCDLGPLLKRKPTGKGFLPAPRVYVSEIGTFLSRDEARKLFAHRTVKNRFACQLPCCPRGVEDMLADPRRHFLVSRAKEIEQLSRMPLGDRADHYLETWLRPASDRATFATRLNPKLLKQRERLDRWRESLGELRARDRAETPSISVSPARKRIRRPGVRSTVTSSPVAIVKEDSWQQL